MTKRERAENRLPRLTAYATAEGYRLKFLQAFLKREHGVGVVRVFDDCLYAVGHLDQRIQLTAIRYIIFLFCQVMAPAQRYGLLLMSNRQAVYRFSSG